MHNEAHAREEIAKYSPTYPLSWILGEDLRHDMVKDQWIALVVDMMRSMHGEDVSADVMRADILQRMDALHGSGNVPRTLSPVRYPRNG